MTRRQFITGATWAAALARPARLAWAAPAEAGWPRLAGLTPAQQERALRLHRESLVINCHDHMWRRQDYLDMLRGGVTAKIYKPLADGLYWDEKNRRTFPPDPFDWTAKFLEMVEKVERLERSDHPGLVIVRRVDDIYRAQRQGKAGIILGNEGTLPLAGSIEKFEQLYQRGLRELALFWPAGGHTRHVLNEGGHLTAFAQQIIAKANELGVVLDPSHLAASPAFRQVLELSKAPVIHTHGAPRFPRTRKLGEGDLADKQILALADRGGVIGLHFCTYIKNPNGWNWAPTLDDLIDHVEHIVKVGGIECLGIGADHFPYNRLPVGKPFDEIDGTHFEDRDWSRTFVEGLVNISAMPLFTQGLVARGFSDSDIEKILGGNVMRVLKAAWRS